MLAVRDIAFRCLHIGFFDEGLDGNGLHAVERRTNVAEAGFRVRRHDAEGHEFACRGRFGALRDRRLKALHIGDDVIGRHHQQ